MTDFPASDQPDVAVETNLAVAPRVARPWVLIVWDDPVNLMSYVVYVFQKHFGFSHDKATRLMYEVHEEGKSVITQGSREEMEMHAQAMHSYGLWATIEKTGES